LLCRRRPNRLSREMDFDDYNDSPTTDAKIMTAIQQPEPQYSLENY